MIFHRKEEKGSHLLWTGSRHNEFAKRSQQAFHRIGSKNSILRGARVPLLDPLYPLARVLLSLLVISSRTLEEMERYLRMKFVFDCQLFMISIL